MRIRSFVLTCAALSLLGSAAAAQGQAPLQPVRGWELPWLDITPNGGWRVKARAVAAARARLLARGDFAALNAPSPAGPAATAVTGVLNVPAIMFRYQNSPPAQYSRDTSQYNATLFGTVPPNGKPYTLRTFYEQLSNTLFSLQGQSVGWVALANSEANYTGAPGACPANPFGTGNCNGLFSNDAFGRMQNALVEALGKVDSAVDFSQFDDNSDGIVDAVLFLHPSMDGACVTATNNHLWSHRSSVFFVTNDPAPLGNMIVQDYILQSGLGSPTGGQCDSTAIMPIGTAAHELGHILALPDLYDTSNETEGIGQWSLMASGNYTKPESPARYDAWSLEQMGWATIRPLTATGSYRVGPEPTADTIFMVTLQGANPRGEYFLLENRQAVHSDSALIRLHGGGGLLVFHIDGLKACLIPCPNNVNAGPIHGVALAQADGQFDLDRDPFNDPLSNRGDGGDPYPGTSNNPVFSFSTTPAAVKNADGSFVGFALDSIREVVPNGEMAFRLRFGALTTVQASDTTAVVRVDGTSYNVFRELFDDGSNHTIAVTDSQLTASGRTRFTFQSWSDGGAISHSIVGALAGGTFTATLAKAHRLNVTVGANGSVSYNPTGDSSGTFIPQGSPVTLTATPNATFIFGGWSGDTVSTNAVLTLPMGRPYAVTARFDAQLVITSGDPRPGGIMGTAYADTLVATGGSGTYTWQVVLGALPPGLTLGASGRITGTPSQTGTFTFTAQVTSGAQQAQLEYSVTITAPVLVKASVVAQLLSGGGALTPNELEYLDLLGNNNNVFDVGDFLAWVVSTNQVPAPPATAAASKGGRP
ncbi:MAG: M6 family metalloprotease domain-containing protein [Gemmatimonadales bacterium]